MEAMAKMKKYGENKEAIEPANARPHTLRLSAKTPPTIASMLKTPKGIAIAMKIGATAGGTWTSARITLPSKMRMIEKNIPQAPQIISRIPAVNGIQVLFSATVYPLKYLSGKAKFLTTIYHKALPMSSSPSLFGPARYVANFIYLIS